MISGLVKSGSMKVVAGYYDLGTGSVMLVSLLTVLFVSLCFAFSVLTAIKVALRLEDIK